MDNISELRKKAQFVDVVAGESDTASTVYRFPNDETGHGRAVQYRNAYNRSLLAGLGLTDTDLELERPDWNLRRDEYDRAMLVEQFRYNAAGLSYVLLPPVVGNNDPLPDDYPHDFGEDSL